MENIISKRNADGTIEEVNLIINFEFNDNNQNYVVYTKNEKDDNGNTTLYVSYVDKSDEVPKLLNVESDEVWDEIKNVLRDLRKTELSGDLLNRISKVESSELYDDIDSSKIKLTPESLENVLNNVVNVPVVSSINNEVNEVVNVENNNIVENNEEVNNFNFDVEKTAAEPEITTPVNEFTFDITSENEDKKNNDANEMVNDKVETSNNEEDIESIISNHKKNVEDYIKGKEDVANLKELVAKSEEALKSSIDALTEVENQISFEEKEIEEKNQILKSLTMDQGSVVKDRLIDIERERDSLQDILNNNQKQTDENNQKSSDGEARLVELRNKKAELEKAISEVQNLSSYSANTPVETPSFGVENNDVPFYDSPVQNVSDTFVPEKIESNNSQDYNLQNQELNVVDFPQNNFYKVV